MSDKAYTVIGTNVIIDCGTAEEAIAYERELWANQPYAPATPAPLGPLVADGCPACHHPDHDPGSCEWCPRCELHTDDAFAWVQRIDPDLIATPAPLDGRRTAAAAAFAEALHRDVPWFVGGSQDAENAMLDAIEAEARATLAATPAPLDEGRLARVMRGMCDCIRSDEDAAVWARDIATGYAVLQRIEAPDEGNEWQERNE